MGCAPPQFDETALDLAKGNGYDEVVALLEAAQAPAVLGACMMDVGRQGAA